MLGPDGRRTEVDIRTLPFVRFQGNEAHAQIYGMNLGEGVDGVGPDASHPFLVREMRIWDTYWAFRPGAPATSADVRTSSLSSTHALCLTRPTAQLGGGTPHAGE